MSVQVPHLDNEFLKYFINSTVNTLKVQANVSVSPQLPFKKYPGYSPDIAIAGVISISSKVFAGMLAIYFTKPCFLEICNSMFGENYTEITQDIQDACAELLNIIFGGAKAELNNAKGYDIGRAIPTIMTGENIKLFQETTEPVMVMPFDTDNNTFYMEIVIENESN